ncbi:MAG: YegS/Rv2252/BmrU family lipid kinase [Turicibacter sp.]|nr:YegS/Rv2252/BmrU family lipid kinase [Turicibacter sp.]
MIKDYLLLIINQLSLAGYEVVVYPTKAKHDAVEKLKEARHYDLIIASGGDGTLNEVITGMIEANANIPIGYIPTGTTNDFATSLGIPKNIPKALSLCVKGKPLPIDIGQFGNRYFTYVAAFGAFTDVAYETPQPRKNMLGGLAYLIEGLLKLPTIQSYKCKITYSEGMLEGDYIFGMISNSDSVAGIKNAFGNQADLSDGLFEVTLIRAPKSLIDIHRILNDFLNTQYDPEYVVTFKTSHLIVESEEEVKWTLDGEDGGVEKLVDIRSLQHRIQILTLKA